VYANMVMMMLMMMPVQSLWCCRHGLADVVRVYLIYLKQASKQVAFY